ncbi:MAG: tyrosine-type recombinase/integrase, partial [Candidatus Wenzhouxiangella sp. M2_3B_020]
MKIELPESPPVEYYEGGKLTESQVAALEPGSSTYKRSDGKGLFLEVTPKGAKRWRLAYRIDGRQKKISMGVYPKVSLVSARINTARAKALLRDGQDPSVVRRQRDAEEAAARARERNRVENRFRDVVAAWIRKNDPSWSAATAKQTRGRLSNDVLPYIGEIPIQDLTRQQILEVTQRIVDRGAIETARRVLRLIRQVCAFAVITGRLGANPASDLSGALPTPKAKHMAALIEPADVAGLLRAIQDY